MDKDEDSIREHPIPETNWKLNNKNKYDEH